MKEIKKYSSGELLLEFNDKGIDYKGLLKAVIQPVAYRKSSNIVGV